MWSRSRAQTHPEERIVADSDSSSRTDFEGNRTSGGSKFSPGFFSRKRGRGTGATRFSSPPPPKNKKRGGQIFAVTPTPLVPSCIALVRRHVIIPGWFFSISGVVPSRELASNTAAVLICSRDGKKERERESLFHIAQLRNWPH